MGFSYTSFSVSLLSFCLVAISHFLCFSLLPVAAIPRVRSNETDQLALVEFKTKITNDPFNFMSSWNNSLHFCQWSGVTCGRRHQRVTVLDLNSLKLSGSISPHVGNLSFLRELYLENNSFLHAIPPQIGYLHRLQILSLFNNSIGGKIPYNISSCSNLVVVDLENNMLEGEIPVWLGSLPKLELISLGNNHLTGTIPSSLGNLSSLQEFDAYINNLRGIIPHTLGQLMNLKVLSVFRCWFSGTIPYSIFNLSLIEILDVSSNQLEGNLPSGFSLPNIQVFQIGSNKFTGSFPISISNSTNLERLDVSSNNLSRRVPSLEKLHRLITLAIADNHFGSGDPEDGNGLSFLSTLTNASNLQSLIMSWNNFGGKLPEYIFNFWMKIELIVIDNNQISGNFLAEITNLVTLQGLYASNNKLSGPIPSSIGKLKNLKVLALGANNLSGTIPSSVGNFTNLIQMDLSFNNLQGVIPPNIGNCIRLFVLDLSVNNLTGPIPPQLTQLSSLATFLDLSRNRLSGSLPNDIGKLKNLGRLAVHENMLSGDIPTSLGSCASLEFLNMGTNSFQGPIPSSLSSLRGLRLLNLSRNNFSGKIPEFLEGFKYLELLDLSYNGFQGMVPTEGVFKKKSATSVTGNEDLCGDIPDFGLPLCKLGQPKRRLTVKWKIIICVSSVIAVFGALLLLVGLFVCNSRKRKRESTSKSTLGNALLRVSYQSLLKATNAFSSANLIGIGSYGSVYKGTLDQEGIAIAVKVLNLMRRGASRSFIAECEALKNVRHRNLVKVLTACSGTDYHGNDFKALVYEFMSNGNLDGWLHPTSGSDEALRALNVMQRLNIAIDVACALDYLHHDCGSPIVHCDLKPSNVLLDEEMTAQVSDFGLAKFLSNQIIQHSANQSSSTGTRGTIGYCPPEYGTGSEVSTNGDTYSYGITLMEMFTGKRPTDDMFNQGLSLHNFVERGLAEEQVTQITDPNLLQMQLNEDAASNRSRNFTTLKECLIKIFEIGISCSAESPQKRMNIGDVVTQLSSIRNKLARTRLYH